MTDILSSKFTLSDQVIESQVGDETVLLHLESGTYYGLDTIGTVIWGKLKEGAEPAEICEAISQEYDVSLETAQDDARNFLNDLKKHQIIIDG